MVALSAHTVDRVRAARADAVVYRGVSKHYRSIQALRRVDLTIETGKIHALVGENGAGKSTCLGILAGRIPPTSGSVDVFGRELHYGDPRASRRAGVVAIYQELTIVPAMSAHANVFLGQPLSRRGFLSEREMRRRYVELCHEIGVAPMPAGAPAGVLSVADRQLLEIMRGIVADAQIILFDEPTASLGVPEREALLRLMGRLRERGTTLVFVSHNLEEVLQISDMISVFRDGELVVTDPRPAWTKPRLVQTMIGDDASNRLVQEMLESEPSEEGQQRPRRRPRREDSLLRAEGVTVPGAIEGIDVEVRVGEIVGLGGLVGSGRTSLLRALAGLEPRSRGQLWIGGAEARWPRTARKARQLGIAMVPEDRKSQGLVPEMAAMDNIALPDLSKVARNGLLSQRIATRQCSEVAAKFGFDRRRIRERAANLSGGNQQKLLLARWNFSRPRVLLVDEPTRGIDVGAKAEIMAALEAMAGEGMGIVVVSSELEEVAALSHRVIVLSEGKMTGVIDGSVEDITVSGILHAAFEVRSAGEHAEA